MIPQHWFSILNTYESIFIALSGGLDSSVLLHFLSQRWGLSAKIKAIHINHGIHPDAALWEAHCIALCHTCKIPCFVEKIEINGHHNLEERARTARYEILQQFTHETACLLTAHHQEDQAETVLLNLMRGAGIAGLCAMPASKPLGRGILYRPLLQVPHQILLNYAKTHDLRWIDDPANQNLHFSRNFIRHEVLPLLKTRWNASHMLANTSELAQEAQNNLNDLARMDCPMLDNRNKQLCLTPLMHLSESRLNNVIRLWLKQHHIQPLNRITWHRVYHELIHASPDANPSIPWDHQILRRYQNTLYLTQNKPVNTSQQQVWHHFPKPFTMPDLGVLHAEKTTAGVSILPYQHVEIRYRQGGEMLYWHGQHQSLKKLMQNWRIPPWERSYVPLLYVDNIFASVIGYGISDHFYRQGIDGIYTISVVSKPKT